MKNIEKYKSLLETGEVDALLLTSEYNRLYAAQYSIAEGVAVVTKDGAYYFTDSRYIEAAENNLPGFTVRMTHPASSEIERINEVIGEHTIKKLGFEESNMTYAMFLEFQHALHAVLVPMQKKIDAFRASKEPWELELMRKAQEITDLTFAQLQKVICAGMTEKDLRAELIYRLYKNGANGLSFDPIVVSGPNTSMPHGVPSDRELQFGDFITMDFGCLYKGYCSDMTRTVALGFVTEEMDKVYKTVLKAQLAGIAAALEIVKTPYMVVAPCDSPFLPSDYVERLAGGLNEHRGRAVAAARTNGREQPVFMLIKTDAKHAVREALATRQLALHRWLNRTMNVVRVDFDDQGAFENMNRAEDLTAKNKCL